MNVDGDGVGRGTDKCDDEDDDRDDDEATLATGGGKVVMVTADAAGAAAGADTTGGVNSTGGGTSVLDCGGAIPPGQPLDDESRANFTTSASNPPGATLLFVCNIAFAACDASSNRTKPIPRDIPL